MTTLVKVVPECFTKIPILLCYRNLPLGEKLGPKRNIERFSKIKA